MRFDPRDSAPEEKSDELARARRAFFRSLASAEDLLRLDENERTLVELREKMRRLELFDALYTATAGRGRKVD